MQRKTFKRLCYCDKFDYYDVDKVHDLEKFPYPFDDGVVDEIWLSHVLERIGQDPDVFNKIIKELYRICKNNALIYINLPHPRHDDFITDPTHVRPANVAGLELYKKAHKDRWAEMGAASSPLALFHNVNFEILKSDYVVDERIIKKSKLEK